MKKTFFLLIMGLLLSVGSMAQKSVSGIIKDDKGEPIPGINCYVKDQGKGAVTDLDGRFTIQGLDESTSAIEVSGIGYGTTQVMLNQDNLDQLEVTLKAQAIITEDVIVRANRFGSKTPMTYTNISEKLMNENRTGKEITSLLALSPSVLFTSESGTPYGYSHIRVRGSDPSRVNVTIDGVPVNDPESHGTFWSNMPDFVSSVNSVQVQRGVGSSSNGAASFGASINFQTDKSQRDAFAQVDLTAGSFGTFSRSIKAGTGLLDNKFNFSIRYSEVNSDGFVDRAFVDHQAVMFTGSYTSDKTIIRARIMRGDQQTGISWWGNPNYKTDRTYNPAGEYKFGPVVIEDKKEKHTKTTFYDGQTDNYKQDFYNLNILHSFTEKVKLNVTPYIVKGAGYYEQYKQDESLNDYNCCYSGDITTSDLIRQRHLDNILYGVNANLNIDLGNLNVVYGLGGNFFTNDHFGEVKWVEKASSNSDKTDFWTTKGSTTHLPADFQYYFNTGEKTDVNTFLKLEYDVNDKLRVYTDLQQRYIEYKAFGKDNDYYENVNKARAAKKNLSAAELQKLEININETYNFFNPKLGLHYQLDKASSVYGSLSIANREPNRANMVDANKGGNTKFPTHETLYDYELGYSYSSSLVAVNLNAFYMDYTDQLVNTGEVNDVGSVLMTNVASSYRAGIELASKFQPISWLSLTWNFTYMQSKIKDYEQTIDDWDTGKRPRKKFGDVTISYSPEILTNAILELKPREDISLMLTGRYVSDQFFDNTQSQDRKIEGYFTEDATLRLNLQSLNMAGVTLFASVNNILDHEFETHAYGGFGLSGGKESTWAYYFPQAGRNYMIRAQIRF